MEREKYYFEHLSNEVLKAWIVSVAGQLKTVYYDANLEAGFKFEEAFNAYIKNPNWGQHWDLTEASYDALQAIKTSPKFGDVAGMIYEGAKEIDFNFYCFCECYSHRFFDGEGNPIKSFENFDDDVEKY